MSIDHLSLPGRSPGFTTYYNQRGVAVTDHWLVVHGSRFPITELHHIERARGPVSPSARTALFGFVGLFAVVPVALVSSTPVAWAIAALTVAAGVSGAVFCGRRWPATFQMWADYRSRPTLLFETDDEQEFGHVSRALIRAVEHDRDGILP